MVECRVSMLGTTIIIWEGVPIAVPRTLLVMNPNPVLLGAAPVSTLNARHPIPVFSTPKLVEEVPFCPEQALQRFRVYGSRVSGPWAAMRVLN